MKTLRLKRCMADRWLATAVVLAIFVLSAQNAKGACPQCKSLNPNHDPNNPYESEPECIPKPKDIPECESKDKSCPQPDVSGEAKYENYQWISGRVTYENFTVDAVCKEGCDGEGNVVYKAVGDVTADIKIWVAKYAPVNGSPLICGFGKKERSEANIQATIDHELIHCEAMVDVLNSLRKTLCDSPAFTSAEDCGQFVEKFGEDAQKYWKCKRERSMHHCDFSGHRGSTFDNCGNEFPGDPLTPPGNCPDCTAP